MNKQGHFEQKPTLRATSVFAARPSIAAAVVEGVPPVVGKYPVYPLISYVFTFPKHWHRFLRGEARPVPV